jgi:hypothetical protein
MVVVTHKPNVAQAADRRIAMERCRSGASMSQYESTKPVNTKAQPNRVG